MTGDDTTRPARDAYDKAKERLNEDRELERQCSKCQEWWPADREFFFGYIDKDGNEVLHSWCKACTLEKKKERRQRNKLAVAA